MKNYYPPLSSVLARSRRRRENKDPSLMQEALRKCLLGRGGARTEYGFECTQKAVYSSHLDSAEHVAALPASLVIFRSRVSLRRRGMLVATRQIYLGLTPRHPRRRRPPAN